MFPRSDRAEDESLDELKAVFLRRNKHWGCEDDDERKEEVEENEGRAVESLETEAMETGGRERERGLWCGWWDREFQRIQAMGRKREREKEMGEAWLAI